MQCQKCWWVVNSTLCTCTVRSILAVLVITQSMSRWCQWNSRLFNATLWRNIGRLFGWHGLCSVCRNVHVAHTIGTFLLYHALHFDRACHHWSWLSVLHQMSLLQFSHQASNSYILNCTSETRNILTQSTKQQVHKAFCFVSPTAQHPNTHTQQ